MNTLSLLPLLVVLPAFFAWANFMRGRKSWYVVIPAAGLSLVTLNPVAGIAYVGGESFGWGQWLRAINHWFDDEPQGSQAYEKIRSERQSGRKNGIHAIAKKIAGGEMGEKVWRRYVFAALTVRGAYWWLPVYTVLAVSGLNPVIAIAAMAASAAAFAPSYILAKRVGDDVPLLHDHYWGRGEQIYGFFYGLILAIALVLDPSPLSFSLTFW